MYLKKPCEALRPLSVWSSYFQNLCDRGGKCKVSFTCSYYGNKNNKTIRLKTLEFPFTAKIFYVMFVT